VLNLGKCRCVELAYLEGVLDTLDPDPPIKVIKENSKELAYSAFEEKWLHSKKRTKTKTTTRHIKGQI
jgi:hypothetical protein